MLSKLSKLIDVKSFVTLALTAGMLYLLFGNASPSQETMALFCTSYGAVITYFFTKKSKEE